MWVNIPVKYHLVVQRNTSCVQVEDTGEDMRREKARGKVVVSRSVKLFRASEGGESSELLATCRAADVSDKNM